MKSSRPTVVFRVDANRKIGGGHFTRCLALAEQLNDTGCHIVFLHRPLPVEVLSLLSDYGIKSFEIGRELSESAELALIEDQIAFVRASWKVLDGYQFTDEYIRMFSKFSGKLLILEDAPHRYEKVDVIVNASPFVTKEDYQELGLIQAELLLGPEFQLLRKAFLKQRWKVKQNSRILFSFGGADEENLSTRFVDEFERVKSREIQFRLIVGSYSPHREELKKRVHHSKLNIEVLDGVREMGQEMLNASVVVSTAGMTAWELAVLGVPSLLIKVADNQHDTWRYLTCSGGALSGGSLETFSEGQVVVDAISLLRNEKRQLAIAQKLRGLCDGKGAKRVVNSMEQFCP